MSCIPALRAFLGSVLNEGQLLMPGDTLLDGSKLGNARTRGGDHRIQVTPEAHRKRGCRGIEFRYGYRYLYCSTFQAIKCVD